MKAHNHLLAGLAVFALVGCTNSGFTSQEAGHKVDMGGFGNATMNNTLVMSGAIDATQALGNRFASEIPTTITFPFNSAELTAEARATLAVQANFIRQFPEVRFRVYGHTDLVGSDAYNKALGLRRAKAVVAYFAANGISKSRVEAVVSHGKTQPVIQTPGPEERNRRTVTEVTGFVDSDPMVLNGKYAAIVWRSYVNPPKRDSLAERIHPDNTTVNTQVDPAEGN